MQSIDVRTFEESFVIHFGGEFARINAYTLASTLVAIADAVKDANAIVNPGYDVEVVVEAIGRGSFRAKIKTLYNGLGNIFASQSVRSIVLSIIASYIYQHALAPDQPINIKVDDRTVIVEQGNRQIIIPRDTYEALKQVEKSEKFRNDVGRSFKAIEKDPQIQSFGIAAEVTDPEPVMDIPRSRFPGLIDPVQKDGPTRDVTEFAELRILRAILDKTRRRWEFVWRGIRISAPISDEKFYRDFFAHRITIAPGDALEVKLRIHQVLDVDTGIYTNQGYDVEEVIRHIPRPKQTTMDKAGI